ncbi:redox-active disulfide protein [Methanobrevibacter ruminantium M1]|uniref:Redox-active disulfide protein n=1 Tax=Methanobrevibacter ruminantium (strain ATCC 35063 / DSM 1093 / JCM 13430 / OCM 146 / M1) TaxID=634498 RepID=D3DYX8_METRM|nr:thioredoxin family protein [Methanobrevibacter ruminantium]ADC47528.1 redox-active disulfide protein [Methanobrevibacter ruminantium M1]
MVYKVEVFTSPTCPHCPGAVRLVEKAKEELGDALDVTIYNTAEAEAMEIARKYHIMYVPTIIIDGEIKFQGAPSYDELMAELK